MLDGALCSCSIVLRPLSHMIEISENIDKVVESYDSYASTLIGEPHLAQMVDLVHQIFFEKGSGQLIRRNEKSQLISIRNGAICSEINGEQLKITIYAETSESLHALRELVSHYAEEHLSELALDWTASDELDAGSLPPTCRVATVVGVERLGQLFIRVKLCAEKLDRYNHAGLHFRIGIPPIGRKPVWPFLSENGRTTWAKGADKLHLPAFTTVSVNLERNELVFDLFSHQNGPTCEWAEGLLAGIDSRNEILLSGPGGGWMPPQKKLLIAGDETALPTIRRTLATANSSDDVIAFIELENLMDVKLIAAECGHHVRYLDRSRGESLSDAVLTLRKKKLEDRYLWFAGEKTDADKVREVAKSVWHVPRGRRYVAAFWKK